MSLFTKGFFNSPLKNNFSFINICYNNDNNKIQHNNPVIFTHNMSYNWFNNENSQL